MRGSVALLVLVSCSVSAQSVSPMLDAVARSMHQVCKVNRDSRQCEILQDLYADQMAIEQGRAPQMRPVVPPEEKAIVRKTIEREAGVLTESSMRTVEAVVLRNYKVERGLSR